MFARHVDLPRGPEREIVRERTRSYELNGRESDALATIAAFRVVQVSDVREMLDDGRGGRSAQKSLEHLQASGLLERIPLERRDEDIVALTNRGRDLLEANRREPAGEPRQVFYAGLKKPRELTHDANVYRACRDAEAQIRNQGGRVLRVVLDYEFKREYQQFLQERNRGRADSTGRPDRTPEEIAAWAKDHDLPYHDDRVRFPDARIEFENRDRQGEHRDIEVVAQCRNDRGTGHGVGSASRLRACTRILASSTPPLSLQWVSPASLPGRFRGFDGCRGEPLA